MPPGLVTRTGLEPGEVKHHPLLTHYPWAELLAPIVIGETKIFSARFPSLACRVG
ncbi:hypothetical protein TFLX_06568 [Thermoflexales bacterium]|nr:hypothetical protein TFLX_06568 [Thermoflexales bacterium]